MMPMSEGLGESIELRGETGASMYRRGMGMCVPIIRLHIHKHGSSSNINATGTCDY